MTLAVPLTVRLGDRSVTRECAALAWRKEAIGGLQSITLRIAAPLVNLDTAEHLTDVTVYDSRTAEIVAQGRVADTGRSASADGQMWDITCFGPAQHASDRKRPLIYVDTRLDTFKRAGEFSTKGAQTTTDERPSDTPSLLVSANDGKTVGTSWQGTFISRAVQQADMKLARLRCQIDAGVVGANYIQSIRVATDDASLSAVDSASADTSTATLSGVVVTDFSNGHNQACVQAARQTSSVAATDDHWFEFWGVVQRTLLLDADGTEITTGYSANTVLAHEIVADLLGRVLNQYDGAGASIDTTAAYTIDQAAWPDGITPAEVLEDLMALEPAYFWTTGPDVTGNGYQFWWKPWPTTVRYEGTPDDGADFPASMQTVFNKVTVRWQDEHGKTRTRSRTSAAAGVTSPTLDRMDELGITRDDMIDAGDEIGSSAAATRLADNFLDEHANPQNAGTITISRPIRDLSTGAMVDPHEIEPSELIRVRGVESYVDSLNADSSDGRTVFRIWAVNYSSDSHSAQLELDTYPRTTAAALARLAKRRRRKR